MGESTDDIDQMFSNLLGEMDLLTQSLGVDTLPPPDPEPTRAEFNYSVGFQDLNESLNALEDKELDALMAELVADISEAEQRTIQAQKAASQNQYPTESLKASASFSGAASLGYEANVTLASMSNSEDDLPPPPADPMLDLPLPPPPPPPEPLSVEEEAAQAKADKIKLALEKLKEAKVKKLVVKVHMDDNSTKSLMVDERQLARDVLDNLFEKTHCDYHVDWCLYEIYPELQIERLFEDHENVVEVLSNWTRDTENKLLFLEKEEKYAVFKNPQNFYLDNKGKKEGKDTNEKMNAKNKESLLEESFCGTSVIVPELEGALYLKEDGKKSWKRRYFLLRASGIYYVPKGKTKTSRDLACFIQFENVNIYYATHCKMKYKAPTDYCFVLKTNRWTTASDLGISVHFQDYQIFMCLYSSGRILSGMGDRKEEHPQIQKESQYIKYLCCDDARTLNQWITGIRIAKYGKTLYDNYQRAVTRAGLASRWANLGTVNPSTPVQPSTDFRTPTPLLPTEKNGTIKGELSYVATRKPSKLPMYPLSLFSVSPGLKASTAQPNGQIPQAAHSVSAVLPEARRQVEPATNTVQALRNQDTKGPRVNHLPKSSHPPPPPLRQSSDTSCTLAANPKSTGFPAPPVDFMPPPTPPLPLEEEELPPPPPPPDFHEEPPDFVPPPPPATAAGVGSLPPPPPPPPTLTPESRQPPPTVAKKLPIPPKRQDNKGPPGGGQSGEQDFMSDLMKALQKKRGNMP